jgi:hypothetical protein
MTNDGQTSKMLSLVKSSWMLGPGGYVSSCNAANRSVQTTSNVMLVALYFVKQKAEERTAIGLQTFLKSCMMHCKLDITCKAMEWKFEIISDSR